MFDTFDKLGVYVANIGELIAALRTKFVAAGIPTELADQAAKATLAAVKAEFGDYLTKTGPWMLDRVNTRRLARLCGAYWEVRTEMSLVMHYYDEFTPLKAEHDRLVAEMKPRKLTVCPDELPAYAEFFAEMVAHAAEPHLARDRSAKAFEQISEAFKRYDYLAAVHLKPAAEEFSWKERNVMNKICTRRMMEVPSGAAA